jgi:NhaP-type Na+/H+ or K+/H+ antiporter
VVGFPARAGRFHTCSNCIRLRELTLLESITEIGLLIALFTVGIKIRVPIGDWRWSVPMRLATVSMVVTILGIAAAAMIILGIRTGRWRW